MGPSGWKLRNITRADNRTIEPQSSSDFRVQEGNYSAIASISESPKDVFEEITFSLEEIMLSVDIEVMYGVGL